MHAEISTPDNEIWLTAETGDEAEMLQRFENQDLIVTDVGGDETGRMMIGITGSDVDDRQAR